MNYKEQITDLIAIHTPKFHGVETFNYFLQHATPLYSIYPDSILMAATMPIFVLKFELYAKILNEANNFYKKKTNTPFKEHINQKLKE